MLYALRKLIAFVFLGGIFWFIYQDLDNLEEPWFMHALGMIAVAFGFFWLLIPMVVVRFRIRRRRLLNRERYEKWLGEGGLTGIRSRPSKGGKAATLSSVGEDAQLFFHEKGTLYTDSGAKALDLAKNDGHPVGRPSDVAFPGFRRKCRVDQRTHCYFTDSGVSFAGKSIDFAIPFSGLKSVSVKPGGIVFETESGSSVTRFAFTFHNPLIAADVLRFAKEGK